MKNTHTSLEFSKKLQENWFNYNAKCFHSDRWELDTRWLWDIIIRTDDMICEHWHRKIMPAYDILNDICVKYADIMFWDKVYFMHSYSPWDTTWLYWEILKLLQNWKKKEAEEYIRKHCLFNPKNKLFI